MPSIAIPLSLRGQLLSGSRFEPSRLFSANEPGVWYDPSDLSTMFQDRAGTIPVTAPGQSVGKRLDKSGRGNHAVANSDAARGIYGIEPLGGRRNLLTYTEQFDNAAWNARWGGYATITPNDPTFLAPDGTQTVDRVTATLGGSGVGQAVTLTSGVTYTFSCWVNSPTNVAELRIATLAVGGGQVAVIAIPPSASLTRASLTYTPTVTQTYYVGVGNSVALQTVYVWGAQLETGSTATAYQKVVSQYEVTEAGKPTLHYVQYDGVDDGYVTPTITPSTDKVQVFAGVRKLSDAVAGVIAETSTATASNNGSFYLANQTTTNNFQFFTRGTANADIKYTAVSGPETAILFSSADFSQATVSEELQARKNGVADGVKAGTASTGNFLAYPLYIGRRGGTAFPFNGRDYGLIVRFGSNLSAETIAATETWLNSKTGAY